MAAPSKSLLLLLGFVLFFSLLSLSFAGGADVTLDDDSSPKSPSCDNPFNLVKVVKWVDGAEGESLVGVNARFGALLPPNADKNLRLPAVFSNPLNGCSSSSSELSGQIALSIRGDCDFTKKAEVAQAGGAAALLVINDKEDLYKMICAENETALNISIPVVMISKSGGESLNKTMASGKRGGNLVTWRSKKQKVVALSSAEAEFRGMAKGLCELLWLKRLLTEIGFTPSTEMNLFCDNKAAIDISHNPVQHDRTKHIEVDRHFIKQNLEEKIIQFPFVKSEDQLADMLTKAISSKTFHSSLNKLGIRDIYAPT